MSVYKRCCFIFITGAVGYCLLEILWRGYTHPSMGLAGGICLIGIYKINRASIKSRLIRAILCMLLISFTELIFGLILNKLLLLNVWNYSLLPFNFLGQICAGYSLLWFLLSYIVLFFLDITKKARSQN